MRGQEGGLRESHREEAVPVHGLHAHRQPGRGGREHARQEEEGRVVRDDDTGAGGQRGEESAPRARGRFDVGVVPDARIGEGAGAVGHPGQDESVDPIARVGIPGPERLEDQHGAFQLPRPLDGPVEGEAPRRAPGGCRPEEDVRPVPANRGFVGRADPLRRDAAHGALPTGGRVGREAPLSATRRTSPEKMRAWTG